MKIAMLAAGLSLLGCPENTDTETQGSEKPKPTAKPSSSENSTPSATASATTSAAPSTDKPSVVARAKAELHEKEPDADFKGSALSVTGAKSGFSVPAPWTMSDADSIHKAIDDKGRFGATGYADGDDTAAKAGEVAKALELTDCTWGSDEDISLGKDKVATKVADGVCMRGKTVERAIRAVVAGDDSKIVAVGAWNDQGGDDKGVFNSFRSLAEAKSVAACCAALQSNAVSAPPQQKLAYGAAIVVCQGLVQSKEGRQALAQIRAALPGVPIPAQCQ
jgi:hypothetical protein